MPDAELPMLQKTERNELVYKGSHLWELRANGRRVRDYNTSDVRVSLVWRARCFASEEQRQRWHAQTSGDSLQLETVLETLVADLRKRGRLAPDAPRPPPLELAQLLLDEYARYPLANVDRAWIPLNYCMLPQTAPAWAKPLLAPLMGVLCDR